MSMYILKFDEKGGNMSACEELQKHKNLYQNNNLIIRQQKMFNCE